MLTLLHACVACRRTPPGATHITPADAGAARAPCISASICPADMRILTLENRGYIRQLHFIALFGEAAWNGFPDQNAVVDEAHRLTCGVAAQLGGTFSAAHGIGQYLIAEMQQYKSGVELALMRSIKRALDPRGLFNPAKVLPQ